MIFEQLQQQLGQPPRYVLTGGTLLALLRHGTGAREIDGVLDFVARRESGKTIDADENSNIKKVNKYQALVRPEVHL